MSTTSNQSLKNTLTDLFRAKLIPVDAEAAMARIQDGRENQRTPMIASLLQARIEAEKTLAKIGAARVAQEEVIAKAKAALKTAQTKLNAIASDEAGLSSHHHAKVFHLERDLRELSDPMYLATLREIARLSDIAKDKFVSSEWKERGTWRKVTHFESNAGPVDTVRLGAKAARERIEQLQTEPRPEDLPSYLTKLVEPIECAARDLDIPTHWPWVTAN